MLNRKSTYGDPDSGNLLFQGDSLDTLTFLRKDYSNRIKCIYIDPPYNSGAKLSHYEDALTHDQWLKMMKDRLLMMWSLLTDDGSLWISIDDSEFHYLKVMCDEIFGRESFVTTIVWNQRTSRENRRVFSVNHEYILLYAKNPKAFGLIRNSLKLTKEVLSRYKNPDNDPRGHWQSVSLNVQGGHGTKDQFYTLVSPSGKKHALPNGRCWVYTQKKLQEEIAKNNIWFGQNGEGAPRLKKFLKDAKSGLTPHTLWLADEVGTTDSAKKDLKSLFEGQNIFETPKPEQLLARIIEIATQPGDYVLDCFLGSGTTTAVAHKLNRKWIGIEIGEHCQTYCMKRMVKIIKGEDAYGITKYAKWLKGGGLTFFKAIQESKKDSIPKRLPLEEIFPN
jgi:adenine-specific DNA-methyltransferase